MGNARSKGFLIPVCVAVSGCGNLLGIDQNYDNSLSDEGGADSAPPVEGAADAPGRDTSTSADATGSDTGTGTDATGSDAGNDVTTDSGGVDAEHDGNVDSGPLYSSLSSGDMRLYYADPLGTVSYETFTHATRVWSTPVAIASYPSSYVTWTEPALATSGAESLGVFSALTNGAGTTTQLLKGTTGWPVSISTGNLPSSATPHRGFDVAYSSNSGATMVVYTDGTTNPKYRVLSGGSWSSEAPVFATPPGLSTVDWIQLVANPLSDEITLVYSDQTAGGGGETPFLYATVWNGSSWVSSSTIVLDASGLNVSDFPSFTAAYGQQTGTLLIAWSHPSTCNGPSDPILFTTKANGSTTFAPPQSESTGLVAGPGPMAAASEPGTDRIAIAIDEYCTGCRTSGCNDFSAAVWDGSSFAAVKDLDGTIGVNYPNYPGSMPVASGWVGTTGTAVFVYSKPGGKLSWATYTVANGLVLQTPATVTPALAQQVNAQVLRVPALTDAGNEDLVLLLEDVNGAVWAKLYDGAAWTDLNSGNPVASNIWVNSGRAFGAVVR